MSAERAVKICPRCGTHYGPEATFCQRDGSSLDAPEVDPFVGRKIFDEFEIEAAIGAGGMGTVYRATQPTLQRKVAVKILHPELTSNADAVRRFHREARVATQLDHPNLVRVFLFGELPEDGNLYLVMEYLDGISLKERMERGLMAVGEGLHILLQIAEGVGTAHTLGIVHRDIKPDNIMLIERHGDPDFVKVLDFGIARLLHNDKTALTQQGTIFGTARYISPEGASGEPTDARSDVYSLGILAYQLFSGETPFTAHSPVAMLMKHINEAPPPLRQRGQGKRVPQAIADVVMTAIEKKPSRRYTDADAFREALFLAAEESGIGLSPTPSRSSRVASRSSEVARKPAASFEDSSDSTFQLRRSSPRWRLPLIGFVLGAVIVVGGMRWARARDQAAHQAAIAALSAQAEDAIAAKRYLGEESFLSVIQALEEEGAPVEPLRAQALAALRADRALLTPAQLEEAIAILETIVAIDPEDGDAQRELTELRARPAPPSPGMTITPARLSVRETATFVASMALDQRAGETPMFEIRAGRSRQAVEATRTPLESTEQWIGSYTFRSAGTYQVRFLAASGETLFEGELEVERAARDEPAQTSNHTYVQPPQTPSTTQTQPTTQPTMQPTMQAPIPPDDNIDWSLPGATMSASTSSDPPAPWTG